MKELIVAILTSKKAVAAIAGVIVGLAAKKGLALDNEAVALIVGPIIAYIIGQGASDFGKEAARIKEAA